MPDEALDIDSLMKDRREAVEKNIREISVEELKGLGEELFPFVDHPWREAYFNFIEQNASETFYHATTQDRVHIIYCREKEKGLWFRPGSGKGPLQERGLKILKEIIDQRA